MPGEILSHVLYRERWRARRGLVPGRVKNMARRLGQSVGRFSVRTAWQIGRWWAHIPQRPVPEITNLWTDVRWCHVYVT